MKRYATDDFSYPAHLKRCRHCNLAMPWDHYCECLSKPTVKRLKPISAPQRPDLPPAGTLPLFRGDRGSTGQYGTSTGATGGDS